MQAWGQVRLNVFKYKYKYIKFVSSTSTSTGMVKRTYLSTITSTGECT